MSLILRHLSKHFAGTTALDDVDLSIVGGSIHALVGHNGSGKSTFLKLVAGLLDPSSGSVTVGGHPAGSPDARAAVSYIPDEPVLYDDLSVREHLQYITALHGSGLEDRDLEELCGRLGLADRIDDLPARFSRGLRQKAGLAVGLVRPFEVLLIDEPFVGLDVSGRNALLELLDEAHDAGAALVVATHDPSYVQRVERCIALRDGTLIHDGPATPDQVLELVGA